MYREDKDEHYGNSIGEQIRVVFSCDCSEEEFCNKTSVPFNEHFIISLLLEILKREYSEKKKLRQVSNDIMSNCINIIIGIRSIFVKIILISALKTI